MSNFYVLTNYHNQDSRSLVNHVLGRVLFCYKKNYDIKMNSVIWFTFKAYDTYSSTNFGEEFSLLRCRPKALPSSLSAKRRYNFADQCLL